MPPKLTKLNSVSTYMISKILNFLKTKEEHRRLPEAYKTLYTTREKVTERRNIKHYMK